MKQNFQYQFSNLKSIIETNVETLKGLIKQADHLSDIIHKMENTDDKDLKDQLGRSRKDIHKSINILVGQTHELFKVYESLTGKISDN